MTVQFAHPVINTIPAARAFVGCKVDGQTIVHVRFEHHQISGHRQRTLAFMTVQGGEIISKEVSFT